MDKARRYRHHAAESIRLASQATRESERARLFRIAAPLHEIAADLENYRILTRAPPGPVPEQPSGP